MTSDEERNAAVTVPDRPLLLFDGDCGFCRFWVERWRATMGDRLDFSPAQQAASRFPEASEAAGKRAVQLLMPDGAVYAGAEAVFLMMAYAGRRRWPLAVYRHAPGAKALSEHAYSLVAGHRPFFSKVTELAWGRDPTPPSYVISRWLFLRLLGLIYLIAFISLRVQVLGLIGAHGIAPARDFLQAVQESFSPLSYRTFPTLAWISASDASLKLLCSGGALLGALVFFGVGAGPALVLAWVCYLSLMTVGQDFLSFQWDVLLLETGFLAIFLAPWRLLESPWRRGSPPVSMTFVWLGRWLLFRLMFLSGAVKLLSGDPTWRNLTALEYHYWTQPLPTPVAWYAAKLPAWFQQASVVGVFAVELGVPFLIFAPRRIRKLAAGLLVGFQLLILITGNYCFFNWLTIALCVLLLDDTFWGHWLPAGLVHRLAGRLTGVPALRPPRTAAARAGKMVRAVVAAFILVTSVSELAVTFFRRSNVPALARELMSWQSPLDLVNTYGLFAVMTTSRIEIIVQGSDDGENWRDYEFKYKPGNLARRPPWVAPYQPRLDWQMWFAALGTYQENPWFQNFMRSILQASPDVLALLANNPFPNGPPRYVRAVAYDYRFTDYAVRRATGDWWQRQAQGLYFPAVTLRQQ